TGGNTVDCTDNRLGQLGDFTDQGVVVFFNGLTQIGVIIWMFGALLAQILASTKPAAAAREQDGAYIGVLSTVKGTLQCLMHRCVERIQRIGAIERDMKYPLIEVGLYFRRNGLTAHVVPPKVLAKISTK